MRKVLYALTALVVLLAGVVIGQAQPVQDVAAQVGSGIGNYDIVGNVLIHGNITLVDGADLVLSSGSDLTNAGAVTNNGAVTFNSTVTTNGSLINVGLVGASRQSTVTVTSGGTVAVTSGFVPLAGAYNTVGTSTVTGCSAGTLASIAPYVVLYNTGTNSVVFTDTGTLKLSGNATLGQTDTLMLKCDTGTGNWLQVGKVDN